jgi:hypothetical protein
MNTLHIPKRHLDRRTFLKAGAATLALPLLDAMSPFGRAAAAAAVTPRRMVILDRPLGTYAPYFFPEKAGLDYEAPRLLKILEPQRGKFTVFSGMSHLGYPNDHRTEFALLNGVHPDNIKRMDDMHLDITLDQLAAQHVGGQTRVPYLLLGPAISFNSKGVALPGQRNRAQLFAQLFVDGTPDEIARELRRLDDGKSILDGMRDQLRALSREISSADRQRMEVLTTSIREAEQSLAQEKEWAAKPKPRVDAKAESDPNEWVGQTKQWYDLIHLAMQTDSTRVIVCRVPEQLPAPTVPGSQLGEHDASHHGQSPAKVEQVALYEEAHMRLLQGLLQKLNDSPEAGGSLLDSTEVLSISNMGDGSAHSSSNLPVLLAGGGYKHQGHVAFDRQKNYPLSNLYVRMLRQMGIAADSFGSSTGVLSELA